MGGRNLTDLYRSTNLSCGMRKTKNQLNSSLRRRRKMKKTIDSIERLASAEAVSYQGLHYEQRERRD